MDRNHSLLFSRIADVMGFGRLQCNPVPVSGGLLHRMFRCTTETGEYAVKLLNPEIMARPQARRNMIFSEKAAAAFTPFVPAVPALETDHQQLHEIDGTAFFVYPWIEGRSVYTPDLTPAHCGIIGDLLGRIHSAHIRIDDCEPGSEQTESTDWERLCQEPDSKEALEPHWLTACRNAYADIQRWDREARDAYNALSGQQVICHRDLDPKNVLWNGMRPRIIDWESAGWCNPYLELAQALLYWAADEGGEPDPARLTALLSAYRRRMDCRGIPWETVLAAGRVNMLDWLAYSIRRALGKTGGGAEEIRTGERQAEQTLKTLYQSTAREKRMLELIDRTLSAAANP